MLSEMYKKIVVATDGSENANKAAASAVEMVKMTGAKLFALNVLPYIPHLSYFGVPMEPPEAVSFEEKEYEARLEKDGKKILDVVRDMAEKAGVGVETVMVKGHPGSEIMNFAQKNDIDLIVMGTLGRSGIDRLLMGSVAEDVVRNAKTRVMIVK